MFEPPPIDPDAPPRHLYTADPHIGHPSILNHCARPFASVDAMDAAIVANLAAALRPKDHLWIVGDFALNQQAGRRAFDAIPGHKHLVAGNHDHPKWLKRLGWASTHDLVEVDDGGQTFVLCHYPLVTWRNVRYGALHLFGHVHGNWAGCTGAVNVGVDLWGFHPVAKNQAIARSQTLPPNAIWAQVEAEKAARAQTGTPPDA